jgi:hypothetical protein
METFKTCTVAGRDVLFYFKAITDRRFVVCLLNLGRQRTPRLREMCVNSSLGQTAPKLVNSQCKCLDQIHHIMSTFYPSPLLFISPICFLVFHILPFAFFFHLNLGSFCHASLWNHCISTSFYRSCIFIIHNYHLHSHLASSTMHYNYYHTNLYLRSVGDVYNVE